ncbi:MAG: protein-glutamine gamma-glutamyltransferase, partial [Actinomycetota bacterium]|nr:protein-glutamine gamma-glutamyltransferase [Actinomycetota bacterium]
RRDAALGCIVAIVMLAVAAVFGGDVTMLVPLVIALGGIAVTASLLHRGALIDEADVVATLDSRSIVRASVMPVGLATILALVAFLALPGGQALSTHTRFAHGGASTLNGSQSAGSRATESPASGLVDLRVRGTLPDTPVFSTDADAPTYWQGATFDRFDGTRWLALGPLVRWRSTTQVTGGYVVQQPSAANSASTSPQPADRTDTVQVLSHGPLGVVLSPGSATAYAGPGLVTGDYDGTAHVISNGPMGVPGRAVYSVTSTRPAQQSPDILRAAQGSDGQVGEDLAVPAGMPSRVQTLANSLVVGAASRFDAVAAVESYLRSHEKYNLSSPVPAEGADVVDDFLFVSHQGFCEQFATATVMMLRSVGIPARLLTGYAGSDKNVKDGRRVFVASDAHAWVQVWYPGIGWIDTDPTAGATLVNSHPSLRAQIATALKKLWKQMPGGRLGALLAVVLLCVLGWVVSTLGRRWLVRRRRRAAVDRGRRGDGPVLAAYLRLDAVLATVDRARAPAETLGEFARRLGGMTATAADVAAAVACLERESYGVDPPTDAQAAAAADVFDRLRFAARTEAVALARVPAGSNVRS